jgi:hypothetical protein
VTTAEWVEGAKRYIASGFVLAVATVAAAVCVDIVWMKIALAFMSGAVAACTLALIMQVKATAKALETP